MKHVTRQETAIRQLLRRARSIAIVGASPRSDRHSNEVIGYLRDAGFEVVPVRADGADVLGTKSYRRLEDIPGPLDLVVVFRRPSAAPPHIDEAARKGATAVWLPPGVWSPAAEQRAADAGIALVKERCIADEHRHASRRAGHSERLGVHVRGRHPSYEDNRKRPEEGGYVPAGGGGRRGGGGAHSVLDEKKMVAGRPSPRRGRFKPTR